MIPTYQDNRSIPGGNCLQACVASLLDLPLNEVPHFLAQEPHNEWFRRLARWLKPRGVGCFWTTVNPICGAIPGHCILGIRTERAEARQQREDWLHAVVGKATVCDDEVTFEIVHDPDPRSSPMVEIVDATWIVRNAT